jgi:hypothetical protein
VLQITWEASMKNSIRRRVFAAGAALPFALAATAAGQELGTVAVRAAAASDETAFEKPMRLRAGDGYVKVEAPGYACPTMFDVDGDGTKDLVVGQFNGGKMRMYKGVASGAGRGSFAAGEWLMADGKVAQVPGVW